MQFEEAYYEGDVDDDDAKIISAAPAAARLDQDVFKKIFSFWEPLGHEMWLDLSRDSVQLDRYCRTAQVFKRMLIPHQSRAKLYRLLILRYSSYRSSKETEMTKIYLEGLVN